LYCKIKSKSQYIIYIIYYINIDKININKKIPIETNDEMFKVRGTQNIKLYGYPFYIMMICLYSYLTNKFTDASMIITPISWFIDMIIFYIWHVQAHHRINWLPFNKYLIII